MALAKEIMQGGLSAGAAKAIQGQTTTAITAAGTNLATATDLTSSMNMIGTCAAGAGVSLPAMAANESCVVYNGGANACNVYPYSSSVAINQMTAGSATVLPINTAILFYGISGTQVVGFRSY